MESNQNSVLPYFASKKEGFAFGVFCVYALLVMVKFINLYFDGVLVDNTFLRSDSGIGSSLVTTLLSIPLFGAILWVTFYGSKFAQKIGFAPLSATFLVLSICMLLAGNFSLPTFLFLAVGIIGPWFFIWRSFSERKAEREAQ